MRKFLILASALTLALAACSKVDSVPENQREVSFEVANYISTRAESGVKYDNGSFGTYSWFNATDPLMEDDEVDLVGGVWKTTKHTYYWPKSGSLDFISYSPFDGPKPEVKNASGEYTLAYSDYTVADVDVMYADLATCSSNVDEITDDADGSTDSGYTGVPTLFRHALAKVSFLVQANFLSFGEGTDVTTWELTVTDAKLNGVYTSGDCALSWSGSEWTKPTGNVWTNPGGEKDVTLASGLTLTEEPQPLSSLGQFVLPQALVAGQQTLSLNVHIKTTLSNGNVVEEDYETGELDLMGLVPEVTAWEMNHIITYVIKIKPTASSDPSMADTPEDVSILYDPAVADWDNYQADILIQL